jgi:hypothetical protein
MLAAPLTALASGSVTSRPAHSPPGDHCQSVQYHPVTLAVDAAGHALAQFALAGGRATGSLPLSADDAARLDMDDAFVSDVQLGSYELSNPAGGASPPVCVLDPTYHLYCPATHLVGSLCLTWSARRGARPATLESTHMR